MLLFFKLVAEKNKTKEKDINRAPHGGMLLNSCPGFFHLSAPVNIVENKDRLIVKQRKHVLKIGDGWLVAVIAVDIHYIQGLHFRQQRGKYVVEIADLLPDVFQSQFCKIFAGNS